MIRNLRPQKQGMYSFCKHDTQAASGNQQCPQYHRIIFLFIYLRCNLIFLFFQIRNVGEGIKARGVVHGFKIYFFMIKSFYVFHTFYNPISFT